MRKEAVGLKYASQWGVIISGDRVAVAAYPQIINTIIIMLPQKIKKSLSGMER